MRAIRWKQKPFLIDERGLAEPPIWNEKNTKRWCNTQNDGGRARGFIPSWYKASDGGRPRNRQIAQRWKRDLTMIDAFMIYHTRCVYLSHALCLSHDTYVGFRRWKTVTSRNKKPEGHVKEATKRGSESETQVNMQMEKQQVWSMNMRWDASARSTWWANGCDGGRNWTGEWRETAWIPV